jgi:hypothetical protein
MSTRWFPSPKGRIIPSSSRVNRDVCHCRRCRDHLPDWPDRTELSEPQSHQLIQDVATGSGLDGQVSRSLAELLLDYGEGYIGAGRLY